AVGTPSREDGSADLSFVEEVGRGIAAHLNGYKVIVTKSTVPVGTGQRLRELLEQHGPRPAHFDIVSNPEFLREGAAIEDFMRPNRVVIGADSPQAEAIMRDLYRPLYLIETPFVFTDIAEATTRANVKQRARMVEKIKTAMGGSVAGKCIAVLGLTFKPNTNDLRDAPSLEIIPKLQDEGATIRAYDPAGMDEARKLLPRITLCAN